MSGEAIPQLLIVPAKQVDHLTMILLAFGNWIMPPSSKEERNTGEKHLYDQHTDGGNKLRGPGSRFGVICIGSNLPFSIIRWTWLVDHTYARNNPSSSA